MPPPLALLLCAAFVLLLLRLERRDSAGVSAASWIPTVWMLTIAAKPSGFWFGTIGAESGKLPDQILLVCLIATAAMVLARRRHDWSRALRGHGWLLALLAYMLVSALWSDIPFVALKHWVPAATLAIMGLVIMSEGDPRRAVESVVRRSAYVLIPFSLLVIKYYPAVGVEYDRWDGIQTWIGVTVHKNSLGRLCMVTAFFLAWQLYRRWRERPRVEGRYQGWADVSVLFIALFLLKGPKNAYSATSIATFAVGVAAFLGLLCLRKARLPVSRVALLVLVLSLIGLGLSTAFFGGSNVAAFSSLLGRDETLTGRTDTWVDLLPVVKGNPLLGHGFGSFWTATRREFYEMTDAHNGYLDILLELGAVGLVFYTAWLLSCAQKLHRALADDYEWGSFGISLLLMAVSYNATESALNTLAADLTALVALVSLVVPYEAVRGARRSHLRLRVHLPPQRVLGTPSPQLGLSGHRGPVPILDCGRRQRRRRVRTRDRDPRSDRAVP